ncbi:MAG: hypothetical protein AAF846_07895 [Chloroflexota bacterium]
MTSQRRIILLIIFFVFMLHSPILAQEARDYAITSVDSELIDDDSSILLTIVVTNNGGDAVGDTNIIVRLLGEDPRVLIDSEFAPLNSGAGVTLEIPFSVQLFDADSQAELEVSVGVDNFELANTPIAGDNVETVTIDIPARTSAASSDFVWLQRQGDTIIIADQPYTLLEFSLGVLAFVGILLAFWMFSILVRAIFSRPPRFGTWQPPYGVIPPYDQNSVDGRRWGWQQVAQNSLLLAPPTEGNVHAVKLLMGTDGITLNHWKVTGMRLSQYDVYGRIARTQVLADKKQIRRMNNILKKRSNIDEAKLQKMLRPIADHLVKQFTKKVSKKTSFLPIAFDMRFAGKHGDVRIIFELYQFSQKAWFRIDQWDPMMQVVSQSMQENYTFTIHGKDASEKKRDFRERLRDDLIWLLLESFRVETVTEDVTGGQPAVREQFNVPDTLSGIEPIKGDGATPQASSSA